MLLQLKRIFKGATYTIGRLYIDGKYFCDTLEDQVERTSGILSEHAQRIELRMPGKRFIQRPLSHQENTRLRWNTHPDSNVSYQDCMMYRIFLES